LAALQPSLVLAWGLPTLLSEKGRDPHAGNAGGRTVALAARLARHVGGGWDNPALPDDIAEIAEFLNLSNGATLELVMGIDEQ
jgi:hypothetical protein